MKTYKKLILILILFLLLPVFAYAEAPVIFYMDAINGPKTGTNDGPGGSYLTFNGLHFGAEQGSATVTIGGGAVGAYKAWSDTQVSVQLAAACATGNVVLTTTEGAATAPETFTVNSHDIFFVSLSGTDSADSGVAAVNDITKPFRTPNYVEDHASFGAGDWIVVRGGTYDLDDGSNNIDNGGWLRLNTNGSSGNYITFMGYPGETVTVKIDANDFAPVKPVNPQSGTGSDYSTWANFSAVVTVEHNSAVIRIGQSHTTAQCTDDPDASEGAKFNRVVNIDITGNDTGMMCDGSGSNVLEIGYANNIKVFGVDIHNGCSTSASQSHVIYLAATQRDIEVAWGSVYSIPRGRAVLQVHQNVGAGDACRGSKFITDVNIHDYEFYDLNRSIILIDGSAGDIYMWNLLIHGIYSASSVYTGHVFDFRGGGNVAHPTLYNSVVYANPNYTSAGYLMSLGWNATTSTLEALTLKNNIFQVTESQDAYFIVDEGVIGDHNVDSDYNNFYGSGGGAPSFIGANGITSDPLMTDPANADFTLQALSLCINAGTTLVNALVLKDVLGILWSDDYDIGAYKYDDSGGSPSEDFIMKGVITGGYMR